jgi:ABC-type transport system involved in Fe-S cluster assembly fused permease/ATPase subunit
MLLVYVGCAVLVGLFARWWALIPLVLLAAYQGFWVIMLVVRRSQRRLPSREQPE